MLTPVGLVGNPSPGRRLRHEAGGLGTHFLYSVGIPGPASTVSRSSRVSRWSTADVSLVPVLGGVLLLHAHQRLSGRLGVRLGLQRRASLVKEFIATSGRRERGLRF